MWQSISLALIVLLVNPVRSDLVSTFLVQVPWQVTIVVAVFSCISLYLSQFRLRHIIPFPTLLSIKKSLRLLWTYYLHYRIEYTWSERLFSAKRSC